MIRVHDPISQSCSRSASGFDYLCSFYPNLNDVWASHLSPLILPSKDEIDKTRFLITFAFVHITLSRVHKPIWTRMRTSYIQSNVVLWGQSAYESQTNQIETLECMYHVRTNGSVCCRRLMNTCDYLDSSRTTMRYISGYSPLVTFGVHNGEMWRFDPNQGQWFEVSTDDSVGLCPHIQHFLSMHVLTHRRGIE
jgi:hypothetical protein